MGLVTCRVYTRSDVPPNDPIVGAGVRIYDETGTVLETAGVTNASGFFQFDVIGTPDPAPTCYQARCSRTGVAFTNPELILVYDPPLVPNEYDILGQLLTLPVAPDPLFCRCSGYFTDPGGRPVADAVVRFMNQFEPLVLSGTGVLSKVEVRTDAAGYAVVDLVRGGKYTATVSGLHDERLDITVPDRSSVNLIDLLFPVVASATFAPVGPWLVAVGAELAVVVTVTTSSYVVLEGTANGDMRYATADPSVAVVVVQEDRLLLRGVGVGATTLDLTRVDDTIRRIPDPAITGTGTAITVP